MKNLKHLFLVSVLFIPFIVNAEECATNNAIYLDCPTLKPGQTIECKVYADMTGDLVDNKEYEGDTIQGAQLKLLAEENIEFVSVISPPECPNCTFKIGTATLNNNGEVTIASAATSPENYSEKPIVAMVKIKVSDKAKEGSVGKYKVIGTKSGDNDKNIMLTYGYIDETTKKTITIRNYAKDVCGSLTVGKADNNNNNSGNTTPAKDNKKPTNPSTGITTSFIIVGVTGLIIAGSYIVTKKNKEKFY